MSKWHLSQTMPPIKYFMTQTNIEHFLKILDQSLILTYPWLNVNLFGGI